MKTSRAKRRPAPEHPSKVCQLMGERRYHNRSHSDLFACPECGRHGRFNLNWLGNRKVVVCVGLRFERVDRNPGDYEEQRRLL